MAGAAQAEMMLAHGAADRAAWLAIYDEKCRNVVAEEKNYVEYLDRRIKARGIERREMVKSLREIKRVSKRRREMTTAADVVN